MQDQVWVEQIKEFKKFLIEQRFSEAKAEETLVQLLSLILLKAVNKTASALPEEKQEELLNILEQKMGDRALLSEQIFIYIRKNAPNQQLEQEIQKGTRETLTKYFQEVFGKTLPL